MQQHKFKTELKKDKNKGFLATISVSQNEVNLVYNQILSYLAKQVEVKGFRKGSVPTEVAKNHLNPQTLLEETVKEVVSKSYNGLLEEHQLKPVMDPQIIFKNPPVALDKDWEFEVTGAEKPEVKLDPSYKAAIAKLKEKNSTTVLETLIKHAKIELPEVLLKADMQAKLAQVEKPSETKKEELKEKVEKDWALNLSLEAIADEQKLEVKSEEVQKGIQASGQTKLNPNLVAYLMRQQKAIDYLLTL